MVGSVVRHVQRAFDGFFDGALDAAEPLIVRDRQAAGAAVLQIEPLEGETEQRQRVLCSARLDVAEQSTYQALLDAQPSASQPPIAWRDP